MLMPGSSGRGADVMVVSAPASHLIGQALVSSDALLHDSEAKDKLREKVVAAGGDPDLVPEKSRDLCLGLLGRMPRRRLKRSSRLPR
jgi:uncharacterized protein (TIGR04141 family)